MISCLSWFNIPRWINCTIESGVERWRTEIKCKIVLMKIGRRTCKTLSSALLKFNATDLFWWRLKKKNFWFNFVMRWLIIDSDSGIPKVIYINLSRLASLVSWEQGHRCLFSASVVKMKSRSFKPTFENCLIFCSVFKPTWLGSKLHLERIWFSWKGITWWHWSQMERSSARTGIQGGFYWYYWKTKIPVC